MSDLPADAPVSDSEAIPSHVAGGSGALSPREAARSLSDWRNKLNAGAAPAAIEKATSQSSNSQPASAPEATAAQESAPEADATPPETEAPGETQEAEPAEAPPIEPPRSWTKDAREQWQSLPRETQSYLAEREQERDREVRRSQNEAAEQLKGLTSREQAMEQARLQFEALNQAMLQEYQAGLQGEFADIQNISDIERLADQDWARYNRWQVHQTKLAAKKAQVDEAMQRQAGEAQAKFAKFAQEQDKKFIERVPEFADKDKAAKLQSAAVATLEDIGFTQDELARHWNGQDGLSLRDHRVQLLIADGVRYRQAQEAAKKAVAKPLPAVQRPGVAQPGKPGIQAQIQTLQRQLNSATGLQAIRLGTQLTRLQREAGSR